MTEFLGIDLNSLDIEGWLASARDFALPRLIETAGQALVVALVYLIARWVLTRLETRLTARTQTHIDDILARLVRRLALLSIGFWGLWRLTSIWDLPTVRDVVVAGWIVGFALPLSRAVTDLLKVAEQNFVDRTQSKLDDTALPWVNRTIVFVIVGAAVMIALGRLGVDVTPLLAGASVAGLAISFAAKDTLSNLIAGILLIVDRPFEVGDRIELWASPAGQSSWGDVVEVGIRATKIRTPDNIVVIIPNAVIMQRDIINWTASGKNIRLRIPIGIAYDADAELAKALCLQVAAEAEGVHEEPAPVCIIRGFGASSVDMELRVWLADARRRRDVGDWITDRIKKVFDANGVEIPFPKRDLYIKTMPGADKPPLDV